MPYVVRSFVSWLEKAHLDTFRRPFGLRPPSEVVTVGTMRMHFSQNAVFVASSSLIS